MTIRFGVSPIAWINDDMPELGAGTSVDSLLADVKAIGFEGVELGGAFPREAGALRRLLDRHGLDLVGGWYSGNLLVRDAEREWAAARTHLALLKAMGSRVFIFAETSNAIHGDRSKPLAATPRLAAGDWKQFGARITDFASRVRDEGMRFAYHHHLGTVVETASDLDRFVENTGDAAGFTVDTGHAALGGIDAVATIRAHPRRVAHVHCKDIRSNVFRKVQLSGRSFLEGVLDGMFTVPGDGNLDYAAVMMALAQIGYEGWIIVEAEQDPAKADPRRYQEKGLATLRAEAAAAGLA